MHHNVSPFSREDKVYNSVLHKPVFESDYAL